MVRLWLAVAVQLLWVVQTIFGAKDVSLFDPKAKEFHCCNAAKMDLWDPTCPEDKLVKCPPVEGLACRLFIRITMATVSVMDYGDSDSVCLTTMKPHLDCSTIQKGQINCTCGYEDTFEQCNPLGFLQNVDYRRPFCPIPPGSKPKCLSDKDPRDWVEPYCRYELTSTESGEFQFVLLRRFCLTSSLTVIAEEKLQTGDWPTKCYASQSWRNSGKGCLCVGANCVQQKLMANMIELGIITTTPAPTAAMPVSPFNPEATKFTCCHNDTMDMWDPHCPINKLVECPATQSCRLFIQMDMTTVSVSDYSHLGSDCFLAIKPHLDCTVIQKDQVDCLCGYADTFEQCNPLGFLQNVDYRRPFCPIPPGSDPECLGPEDHVDPYCRYDATYNWESGEFQFGLKKHFCKGTRQFEIAQLQLVNMGEWETRCSHQPTGFDCKCSTYNCAKPLLVADLKKLLKTTSTSVTSVRTLTPTQNSSEISSTSTTDTTIGSSSTEATSSTPTHPHTTKSSSIHLTSTTSALDTTMKTSSTEWTTPSSTANDSSTSQSTSTASISTSALDTTMKTSSTEWTTPSSTASDSSTSQSTSIASISTSFSTEWPSSNPTNPHTTKSSIYSTPTTSALDTTLKTSITEWTTASSTASDSFTSQSTPTTSISTTFSTERPNSNATDSPIAESTSIAPKLTETTTNSTTTKSSSNWLTTTTGTTEPSSPTLTETRTSKSSTIDTTTTYSTTSELTESESAKTVPTTSLLDTTTPAAISSGSTLAVSTSTISTITTTISSSIYTDAPTSESTSTTAKSTATVIPTASVIDSHPTTTSITESSSTTPTLTKAETATTSTVPITETSISSSVATALSIHTDLSTKTTGRRRTCCRPITTNCGCETEISKLIGLLTISLLVVVCMHI